MRKMLGPEFFDRAPLVVARALVGKFLCRKIDGKVIALMITETEAYDGPHDLASHARFGQTKRNTAMFGPPSTIYVYFTYGMHWMLNMVCREKNIPSAVLIRGLQSAQGSTLLNGPAKLTKFLKIDGSLNGTMLGKKNSLWVEDRGVVIKNAQIKKTPRVGIDYAGVYKDKLWRFVLQSKRS